MQEASTTRWRYVHTCIHTYMCLSIKNSYSHSGRVFNIMFTCLNLLQTQAAIYKPAKFVLGLKIVLQSETESQYSFDFNVISANTRTLSAPPTTTYLWIHQMNWKSHKRQTSAKSFGDGCLRPEWKTKLLIRGMRFGNLMTRGAIDLNTPSHPTTKNQKVYFVC